MVSRVPFEQRFQPQNRPWRKRPKRTTADRFVCGLCGTLLGCVLWSVLYLMVVGFLLRTTAKVPDAALQADPFEALPSFLWGGIPASLFGLFGTIVDEERMMDAFDLILKLEVRIAREIDRHH